MTHCPDATGVVTGGYVMVGGAVGADDPKERLREILITVKIKELILNNITKTLVWTRIYLDINQLDLAIIDIWWH